MGADYTAVAYYGVPVDVGESHYRYILAYLRLRVHIGQWTDCVHNSGVFMVYLPVDRPLRAYRLSGTLWLRKGPQG